MIKLDGKRRDGTPLLTMQANRKEGSIGNVVLMFDKMISSPQSPTAAAVSFSKKEKSCSKSISDGKLSGISELSSEREQRMIRQEKITKLKKMQEFEMRNIYLKRNKDLVKSQSNMISDFKRTVQMSAQDKKKLVTIDALRAQ